MNDKESLKEIPKWVQYFMIHVIKRCCAIIVSEIENMQVANGWTPPPKRGN